MNDSDEEPRSIAWRRYDWTAPFASTVFKLYVIVMDGILFVVFLAIAHGVEWVLDLIESGSVPVIWGYPVHAATIVRFGDYLLFVGFVVIQGYKLFARVLKDDD